MYVCRSDKWPILIDQPKGTIVFEIDTHDIYQWSGTEWAKISESRLEFYTSATRPAGNSNLEKGFKILETDTDIIRKWNGTEWEIMTDKASLGLASTEELFRELICRFTVALPNDIRQARMVNRGLILAEMLGGLDEVDKEYRTINND
jgi:hypothetical protein